MQLGKYSMGMGDRFGHQAKAQLRAIMEAEKAGIKITPVWNKSHREHQITGTKPSSVLEQAKKAVKELSYTAPYFIDADHINISNVDSFIDNSDFFTIDIAQYIGQKSDQKYIQQFISSFSHYREDLILAGTEFEQKLNDADIKAVMEKYALAVKKASEIYHHIRKSRKNGFIAEISLDEADNPQSPLELYVIMAALEAEDITFRTLAPRFSGRFNKGIDYKGDPKKFGREFRAVVMILDQAIDDFGLEEDLKVSIHSGSDKFSLYPEIQAVLKELDKGIHLKTAGTTWLEECIGLAEAGGAGLEMVKEIYRSALKQYDEICAPYAVLIDIDKAKLPEISELDLWKEQEMAQALRHDSKNSLYNPDLRQFMHLAYQAAAEQGKRFHDFLDEFQTEIEKNVTENLLERHIKKIFF